MPSLFITFEGGEGAGKSTQIQALHHAFLKADLDVVLTREPGGTTLAEHLRDVIIQGQAKNGGIATEALLFAAARADHVARIIAPALQAQKIVLCDRFIDSTRAYQGGENGLNDAELTLLERMSCGECLPHITFFLDIDSQIGLERARARTMGSDRFEAENITFHEKVRARFLAIAQANPQRIAVIDAQQSVQDIHRCIIEHLNTRFSLGIVAKSI